MKVIGITGGICSGKTTVSDHLKSKSYQIIDTDVVAHSLYKAAGPARDAILKEFGTTDRAAIRDIVFSEPERRKVLENALHPVIEELVFKSVAEAKESGLKNVFVIVPLLFEAGWEKHFDEIWSISTPTEIQQERLLQRGLETKTAQKILQTQFTSEDRDERADLVIDNSGTIENLYEQIDEALRDVEA